MSEEWISVEDRLPDIGQLVVAYRKAITPFVCRWKIILNDPYNGTACIDMDDNLREPTHWMPLPEPPQSEEGNE